MIDNILRLKKEITDQEDKNNNARLQDKFLHDALKNRFSVHVHLISGVKLFGRILSFDTYTIELSFLDEKNNTEGIQIIYKHAIASIVKKSKPNNYRNYGTNNEE